MINKNEINLIAGIQHLHNWKSIVREETMNGRIQDTNISYICNEYVKTFNSIYKTFEIMGILPITSDNLTCIEYTKKENNKN